MDADGRTRPVEQQNFPFIILEIDNRKPKG